MTNVAIIALIPTMTLLVAAVLYAPPVDVTVLDEPVVVLPDDTLVPVLSSSPLVVESSADESSDDDESRPGGPCGGLLPWLPPSLLSSSLLSASLPVLLSLPSDDDSAVDDVDDDVTVVAVMDTDLSTLDKIPVLLDNIDAVKSVNTVDDDMVEPVVVSGTTANVTSTEPGTMVNIYTRDESTPNDVAMALVNSVMNALRVAASAAIVS